MRQILVLLVMLICSGLLICGYQLNEDLSKLEEGLLPYGYRAIGWTENNEWIVEPLDSNYQTNAEVILRSGDSINGVPLQVQYPTVPRENYSLPNRR